MQWKPSEVRASPITVSRAFLTRLVKNLFIGLTTKTKKTPSNVKEAGGPRVIILLNPANYLSIKNQFSKPVFNYVEL